MDQKHISDTENEAPPPSPITKLQSFPNGKPHRHPPLQTTVVVYRECLKNHAATIGGHALDGCGEFIAFPTSSTGEPTSLKCAACGCHRNFHRREPVNDYPVTATGTQFIDFHRPHKTSSSPSPCPSPPSPAPQPTNYAYGHHLLLSLGTEAAYNHTMATPGTPLGIKISGRKRFRTRFSQDQKEKMLNFAEKIGWKMRRCDDKMIADFCNEIGIRRGIFKVWIHNNKNTLGRKEKGVTATAAAAAAVARSNESIHQENGSADVHLHASTNGSSSSS